jgi:hypothetical protein
MGERIICPACGCETDEDDVTIEEAKWCEEHRSGFNWHNNGPRCDAYRLMATPGWHTGTKPCRPVTVYLVPHESADWTLSLQREEPPA